MYLDVLKANSLIAIREHKNGEFSFCLKLRPAAGRLLGDGITPLIIERFVELERPAGTYAKVDGWLALRVKENIFQWIFGKREHLANLGVALGSLHTFPHFLLDRF